MTYAREESLKLYYSGKTKTHICRKFKVKRKLLDYWIKDDIRRKALNLYLLGMKETKICKELNVYITELRGWIKNMNDITKQKRKNIEKIQSKNRRQPAKTPWVNSICYDWNKEEEAKTQTVVEAIAVLLKHQRV